MEFNSGWLSVKLIKYEDNINELTLELSDAKDKYKKLISKVFDDKITKSWKNDIFNQIFMAICNKLGYIFMVLVRVWLHEFLLNLKFISAIPFKFLIKKWLTSDVLVELMYHYRTKWRQYIWAISSPNVFSNTNDHCLLWTIDRNNLKAVILDAFCCFIRLRSDVYGCFWGFWIRKYIRIVGVFVTNMGYFIYEFN